MEGFTIEIIRIIDQTYSLKVKPQMTIYDVKNLIEDKYGIPIYQQILIFDKKKLKNCNRLSFYNIKKDDKIHLLLNIRG